MFIIVCLDLDISIDSRTTLGLNLWKVHIFVGESMRYAVFHHLFSELAHCKPEG